MNSLYKHAGGFLMLGFTAVFVGYLSVWLPGPAAGLSFLGIEMGEWFKFLGLGPRRDLFYLPPITLGLSLALWTATWPNNGWRAWSTRMLAVVVSLLAFPAVEDITGPVQEQYLLRAALVGLVVVTAIASGFWRPHGKLVMLPWALMVVLALIGLILPTWIYFQIRPYTSQIIGVSIGIGLGVWLNGIGNLLIAAISSIEIAVTSRSLL